MCAAELAGLNGRYARAVRSAEICNGFSSLRCLSAGIGLFLLLVLFYSIFLAFGGFSFVFAIFLGYIIFEGLLFSYLMICYSVYE